MSQKEEQIKFTELLTNLIANDAACENLNKLLLTIASGRDPSLHALMAKEGGAGPSTNNNNGKPSPPPRFDDDEKNIMLYIERSKNKNVVVYRGMLSEATLVGRNKSGTSTDEEAALATNTLLKLNDKEPLDAFWLDIDPEYVAANRKKGVLTNRCELNVVDRKMAYGVHVDTHKPVEAVMELLQGAATGGGASAHVSKHCPVIDPRVCPVSFVAISSRLYFVALTRIVTGLKSKPFVYLPVIMGFVNGKLAVTERIYVHAKEGGMFSLPKVEYVDVFGWEIPTAGCESNGEESALITERLSP